MRPPAGLSLKRIAIDCPARHCWVTVADGRRPGLLVEWRRDYGAANPGDHPAGAPTWIGRVIYAEVVDGRWVTVEDWVPMGRLEVGEV